ncbi:hypothetical protein DSM14862_02479 [Sulfitobacter indolifex]|jgi:hypothetical protein|uniref:Succinate dehydrogenase n=1 Tax=Sulfitobacter indolifex HEL-45 TaxID=391624 RepID=A0ABM9X826_9RHOB|nr:hypothetical protein [Sulfitobacter indolifex]EDQ05491.1 hypothetical protein OIHEL45_01735 [Sulfitobacter indolifex HEL-45]UOA19669.1 hypothetical protein DSM14862_02479 [Sulfitobacter indolifex]
MLRTVLIAASLTALTACVEVQQVVDDTARQGSKGVVTEILATRFPQVPKQLITPFTDCIIDNADALELRELARAAVVGVEDTTTGTVRTILSRPETRSCLLAAAPAAGMTL